VNTNYLISTSLVVQSDYSSGTAEVDCTLAATGATVRGENGPYVVNAASAVTDLSAVATVAVGLTASTLTLSCRAFAAGQITAGGELAATAVGTLTQS
jgi:hypothetical protein